MFATRTAEYIATTYFDRAPFVAAGEGRTTPAGFPAPASSGAGEGADRAALPTTGGGTVMLGTVALAASAALRRSPGLLLREPDGEDTVGQ